MKHLIARLAELGAAGERGVLLTVIDGDNAGTKLLWIESGGGDELPPEREALAEEVVRASGNRLLEADGRRVFVEVYGRAPRLFIYWVVDTEETLCCAAYMVGWV